MKVVESLVQVTVVAGQGEVMTGSIEVRVRCHCDCRNNFNIPYEKV